MTVQLSKEFKAMIRASTYGLDSAASDNFVAAVTARLEKLIEGSAVKHVTKPHIRAACTAELAHGK